MDIKELEAIAKLHQRVKNGEMDFAKYTLYAITHHSTAIEGSSLTESQVINLLEYGKTASSKPFEHHLMATDHYKAIQFAINTAKEKKKISLAFIQQISSILMNNTGGFVNSINGTYDISKGELRLSSVRAGSRTFPDYKKVPTLLQNVIKETNLNLEKASTFEDKCKLAFKLHFDFVSIHPFGDGNGRTSRILMNYVLAYFNLPLAVVFVGDRLKYLNALEKTRETEDIKHFYNFMFAQYKKLLTKDLET